MSMLFGINQPRYFSKKPARENLYATFQFSSDELEQIKKGVSEQNEIEHIKSTLLTNLDGSQTYCEVKKKLYIASKEFYRRKMQERKQKK